MTAPRPHANAAKKPLAKQGPSIHDDEIVEDPWPAESSLDEPTLEQKYHGVHAARTGQRCNGASSSA